MCSIVFDRIELNYTSCKVGLVLESLSLVQVDINIQATTINVYANAETLIVYISNPQ